MVYQRSYSWKLKVAGKNKSFENWLYKKEAVEWMKIRPDVVKRNLRLNKIKGHKTVKLEISKHGWNEKDRQKFSNSRKYFYNFKL
jgi:hypothetical protein